MQAYKKVYGDFNIPVKEQDSRERNIYIQNDSRIEVKATKNLSLVAALLNRRDDTTNQSFNKHYWVKNYKT